MRLVFLSVALASMSLSIDAAHAACGAKVERGATKTTSGCRASGFEKPRKYEPYDPGRARAGSLPGFVDIGGGTQVRVTGRVRTEFDYRR